MSKRKALKHATAVLELRGKTPPKKKNNNKKYF